MDHFVKGVKEFEARWIGWAGVNVPDEIGQKALTEALAEKVHLAYTNSYEFEFFCYSMFRQFLLLYICVKFECC